MAKQWEEKQVSLGGAIITAVATLVVGFFVGISVSIHILVLVTIGRH